MADDYKFDIKAIHQTEIISIVLGVLCSLPPLSVVIILTLRYNLLVGERRLVHYIYCIAISDTIVSLCIAVGFPRSTSITCATQGFLSLFFSRASIFFTDVLIFQLFYLILFKRYFLKIKHDHIIVWTLNSILQFVPLTTGTIYGQDDDDAGSAVGITVARCALAVGSGTLDEEVKWAAYTYQLELVGSFVFILIFTVAILVYRYRMSISEKSWSTLLFYPVGLLITYVPSSVYSYYFNSYHYAHNTFPYHGFVIANDLLALNAIYGVILSIIFYSTTKLALYEWKTVIKKILFGSSDPDDDNRMSVSSVISIASTVELSENPVTRRLEDTVV